MTRLTQAALPGQPLPVSFAKIRSLGRGVAIEVVSPSLIDLREQFRQQAGGVLTAQDSQPWRPHVTIQNKVTAAAARALFDMLPATFVPRQGSATALRLWRYLGGPWSLERRRSFGSGPR